MEQTVVTLPFNPFDAEAWAKFTNDSRAVLQEEVYHKSVLAYLDALRDWSQNAPLAQATGRPIPPMPIPPVGYEAPVTKPPEAPPQSPSPVGAISSDGPGIYFGNPLDQGPVGTSWTAPDGSKYVKIRMDLTPFGTQQRWLKLS